VSTINYINKNNLPTDNVIAKYVTKTAMDYIKKVRFDVGCKPSLHKMQELLRMERLVCNKYCYLSSEDDEAIRKQIIQQAILTIDEL